MHQQLGQQRQGRSAGHGHLLPPTSKLQGGSARRREGLPLPRQTRRRQLSRGAKGEGAEPGGSSALAHPLPATTAPGPRPPRRGQRGQDGQEAAAPWSGWAGAAGAPRARSVPALPGRRLPRPPRRAAPLGFRARRPLPQAAPAQGGGAGPPVLG